MDNRYNFKNLNHHVLNEKMILYEGKGCVKIILFDLIPIEYFIFS